MKNANIIIIVAALLLVAVGGAWWTIGRREGYRSRKSTITTKAGRKLKCYGGKKWSFYDRAENGSCPRGTTETKRSRCGKCPDGHFETAASVDRDDMFAGLYD